MLKLNKFGMFVPRVATPTARRAILTNWICLKSFCRSFFELHDHSAVSDDQRFVLPENWTEQLRNKADFTRFKGNVHVLKNEREEKELLRGARVLQDLRTREALGLDVEFMPYRGGVKVCVIQLACHDTAILWRSGRAAGQLPPFLISLLVDSTILKVGHASRQDVCYLHRYYDINVRSVVDTHCWAKDMNCSHQSLRAMCAMFLNLRLAKDMQRSNWDIEELSEKQIRYAATDAWVSLRVFEEMRRKAKQFKIPLTPAFESCESILDGVVVKQREARKRREKARKEREREGKAQGNDVHSALAMRVTVETMSGECVTADHAGNPSMEDHSTDKAVAKAGLTRTEKNRKKRHRYKANKRLRKLANI